MLKAIWEQFLNIAKEEVGSRVVETWFKSISLHRWDPLEKVVYVHTPNEFIRTWIQKNYMNLLSVHLGRLLHVDQPKVCLIDHIPEVPDPIVLQAASAKIVPAQEVRSHKMHHTKIMQQYKHTTLLNSNYLFESFVVTSHNAFTYAACNAIVEKPGLLYNPLFICGKPGVGKTHLLHAIGNAIKQQQAKVLVLYQSADRFAQEFFNAIRFDTMHLFQSKYQAADVLLVDDIQYLENKEATQEAFFHLFNMLYDTQKQIVCAGNTFPLEMYGMAERLRSRLAAGLVAQLHNPTYESKIAIIQKKVMGYGEQMPLDVIEYLALYNGINIRDLEGMLVRIFAFASLTKQPITLALAMSVLEQTSYAQEEATTQTDFNRIIKSISKFYKYDMTALCSKGRNKELVLARQVTMFLMRKMTNKSLRDIGKFLGSRNHATVKHGLIKIEKQTRANQEFLAHIKRLQQDVLGN